MNSQWVYQLFHPWHWLTYGQNAAGVQTVTAVLALLGLFAYTVYTRRMKTLQQETRRGELFPTLAVSSYQEDGVTISIGIRNVGRGPALGAKFWHQFVSDEFELDEFMLVRKIFFETQFLGALMEREGATIELKVSAFLRKRYLFVVDCHDVLGGQHQFRVLRHGGQDTKAFELQTFMVQSPTFLPWLTRIRLKREERKRRKAANASSDIAPKP
jgi:hypothetical protein